MLDRARCLAERRGRSAAGLVWLCAALLPSCHAPAPRPVSGGPVVSLSSRPAVLACQIVVDTSLEATHHPWQSGADWLYETADHLCAVAEGEFGKHVYLPLCGPPAPLTTGPAPVSSDPPDAQLQPADVQLQVGCEEALAALAEVIAGAQHRLDVLMFEWDDDTIGVAVAAWLAAKAGPEVPVRVLVDGGGNLIFGDPDDASAAQVQQAVSALARHPHVEVLFTRTPFGRFDHRKLVVADGCVAWTGGRNFARRAFFEHRDVSFTVAGPLVEQMEEQFEHRWRTDTGLAISRPPGGASGRETASPFRANAWARLVCTEPGNHQLERELYRAVDQARHHIYLENAYLTDGRLVWKLARARRRGVDVRVVTTLDSGSKPIDAANRVTANRLLKAGIRVYLYPGVTHAKAAVVDGCWAYVGTGNFDALSLRHNRELGLAVAGGPVLAELEECLFAPDFCPEWELQKPLPVSWSDCLCEWLASWCL